MRTLGHVSAAILRGVAALIGNGAGAPKLIVEQIESRDWASATFEGQHHRFTLRLEGGLEAVTRAAAAVVAGIGEAEIPLNGHFVADIAAVTETLETEAGHHALTLILKALVLAD